MTGKEIGKKSSYTSFKTTSRATLVMLTFGLSIRVMAQTPEECQACANQIINDANGVYQYYVRQCNDGSLSACSKAVYVLVTLTLKYCSPCFEGDSRQAALESLSAAEEDIRNMKADFPIVSGDYTFSFHSTKSSNSEPVITPAPVYPLTAQPSSADEGIIYHRPNALDQKLAKIEGVPAENKSTIGQNPTAVKPEDYKMRKDSVQASINKQLTKPNSKECVPGTGEVNLAAIAFSADLNRYSKDASMPWSEWVQVPGTTLFFRFSRVKHCEVHYTIPGMLGDFLDYGFFQFRNAGQARVGGMLRYTSFGVGGNVYRGREPFYLLPGETEMEDLGNWFIGCTITAIALEQYCMYR